MDLPLSAPLSPKLVWMAQAGSTNDVLVQAASGPAGSDWPDLAVVATDDQVAGKGRLGRVWTAPAGRSLAVSVLLRPGVAAGASVHRDRWGLLPLVAGLAMARAVSGVLPERAVGLKWPNDVLVDDRKISGVLGELLPDASALVIGAGVNLALTADELPTPAATSLVLEGADPAAVTADAVLAAYLGELTSLYRDWAGHGGDPVASGLLEALTEHSATLGRSVRVESPGPSFRTGVARRLDETGRLIVDTEDGEFAVAAGDVTHLRHRDS